MIKLKNIHLNIEPSQLTAKQRISLHDFVTDFVAVISSQSEGLGKMALGIVKVYLGSQFSANRVVCGQFVHGQLVRGQFVVVSCRGPFKHCFNYIHN